MDKSLLRRADLPATIVEQIRRIRTDTIDEGKQEGPWPWGDQLDSAEFVNVAGHAVLMPEQAAGTSIVRCIPAADGQAITLFGRYAEAAQDASWIGFVLFCERWPNENWYLPILWHPWMVGAAPLAEQLAALAAKAEAT